ncbi:hypothetical protein SDC9_65256 [bioreactor metagenome]|uniref:Uncharacterized protein n=1 Tax=bioreactor metagenome TaxID=1076179 RepID=A0A644XRY4_9ZZZZ
MAPLNHLLLIGHHVVPQIVKAKLVVGAVGDVCLIGRFFLVPRYPMDDKAYRKPHEAVDFAHPLTVAAGQIIVDCDDVDTLAGECV